MLLPLSPSKDVNTSSVVANTTRIVDLYTKDGDLGGYSSLLTLSPDHGMGFALMLSSSPSSTTRNQVLVAIGDLVTQIMVPAFEAAAREEATANFAGTYINSTSGMQLDHCSGKWTSRARGAQLDDKR